VKPIVVVGSINMDLVCEIAHLPEPGQTVMGRSFAMNPGGKGANQAAAVARLGYPSILLGAVGEDSFGHELRSSLEAYGVMTSHLHQAQGASGTASIFVDASGENRIIVVAGANREVTPEYLHAKQDVLQNAGMVLAQLETPVESIEWLADFCDEQGVPLILDPAPAKDLPRKVLSKVAWLTPNQTEAAFYIQTADEPEETAQQLFALGIKRILLKRGAEGSFIAVNDGTRYRTEAFPTRVIDTTAAGDAFNGAFAVGLMQGNSIEESARFASAAAALSVTRKGAQSSLASMGEVQSFLNSAKGKEHA
jgi:ribokinase